MEQMECLKVSTNTNKNKINSSSSRTNYKREQKQPESDSEYDENEDDEDDETETDQDTEEYEEEQRLRKIHGIDFVEEIDNLSKLTVAKLKYYIDENDIKIGKRIRKAELIKIIKKDIQKHFDV